MLKSMLLVTCLVTAIEKICRKSRAGINTIWVTESTNVDAITFGANGEVTAITMVAPNVFVPISFRTNPGTAFFNQPYTRVGNAKNHVQTISFDIEGYSIELREQLESLDACCGYIAIVLDNNGLRHLAGITYDDATGTYLVEQLRTGDGTTNTNADPTSEEFINTITLTSNAGTRAPLLDPSVVIPV